MDFSKYKNRFDYKTQKEEYQKEEGRIYQEFREDALKDVGLNGHPKADKAYAYAWEQGHYAGFREVYNYLIDMAELLKD